MLLTCPYLDLSGDPSGWPRPALDVVVGHAAEVLVPCLVDSGAMNTLLPDWTADAAGIDFADVPEVRLGVGGSVVTARFVPTQLTIGEHSWEAEVGFCEPWGRRWGLLGHRAFFRYFTVTFRTADFELDLAPVET